ncbi:MAG: hypothetical protein VX777_03185 [Chlamydiota bacterium]|nr:hypothetical protein [Chlamydiota bacterium]
MSGNYANIGIVQKSFDVFTLPAVASVVPSLKCYEVAKSVLMRNDEEADISRGIPKSVHYKSVACGSLASVFITLFLAKTASVLRNRGYQKNSIEVALFILCVLPMVTQRYNMAQKKVFECLSLTSRVTKAVCSKAEEILL